MMRRGVPVLGLLLCGLVTACADGPGRQSARTGGRAGAGPSLEVLALRLPEQVAEFTRGATTWHERERPGFGIAVEYDGPGRSAVATVGLYDRGLPSVPRDLHEPVAQQEFVNSVREVLALAETRTRQDLSERDRFEQAVPGQQPLQCARLQGTYGRQPISTLLCLGIASNHFLRIQVTAPGRQVRPVDPIPFVVGVAQAARG